MSGSSDGATGVVWEGKRRLRGRSRPARGAAARRCPVGARFQRPFPRENRSGYRRFVGQGEDSPPRLAQRPVRGAVPAQADDQHSGMARHPSRKIDHLEAHRLQPFAHPLLARSQLLHWRVQVEGQRRDDSRGGVAPKQSRRQPPARQVSFSTACTSSPLPHRCRRYQTNSSGARSQWVTMPKTLYQPPSGISMTCGRAPLGSPSPAAGGS